MPLVCGPKNSRYAYTGSKCPHTDLALEVTALTLAEALATYEKHFKVSVSPAPADHPDLIGQEAKYFVHTDRETGLAQLVDIHVLRDGKEVCAKQNMDFALLPQDIVELGELAC